jgi:hypothetical protein
MSPDYTPILTPEDAKAFIQAVNSLHDGEITDIRYHFNGITKLPEGGHMYAPDETELKITVLVTSIWDSVVELVFEALDDWQLKSNQMGIYGTLIEFNDRGSVIWTTAHSTDMAFMNESNYVICHRMKWRFTEDNRPAEYK